MLSGNVPKQSIPVQGKDASSTLWLATVIECNSIHTEMQLCNALPCNHYPNCSAYHPPHPQLTFALWRQATARSAVSVSTLCCDLFVCLGREGGCWIREESFWHPNHWLMESIGWARAHWEEECVGDVCHQLSAVWLILARGGQRSPDKTHTHMQADTPTD